MIDEISMTSYENLRIINLRLQEFKNNEKLFESVNILLFGGILQSPPVKGHWCFIQPPWFAVEINLQHQFSFFELTMNMRQRDDTEFIDLLNNLRFGDSSMKKLHYRNLNRVSLHFKYFQSSANPTEKGYKLSKK